MADFYVTGPDATPVTGTVGEDRLIYTLANQHGGVNLSVNGTFSAGYSGLVDVRGGLNTAFTGIEHFSFISQVGGHDTITTGAGDDYAETGTGNDRADLGGGNDVARGGWGHDALFGRWGADDLDGGAGNDRLYGGTGDDILTGGWGDDGLFGADGNDFIVAGPGNNTVYGGDGDDFIIGGQGDDFIHMGLGDDFLEMSHTGENEVDGGLGRNTVMTFFEGVPWNNDYDLHFSMNTRQHVVTENGTTTTSTLTRIVNFSVSGHVDATIVGSPGANEIISDSGNDLLSGWNGDDTLIGGGGQDTLYGGWGDDRLDGGWAGDVLGGGLGRDTFVFTGGWDRILDFEDDTDTVEISSSLVDEGTSVQDILGTMTTVVGGDTVIDLGGNAVLRLIGVSDSSILANDMIIV